MKAHIIVAVAAYLAFAVNSVIDKFLLRKSIKEPATYAFYIGLLGVLSILLAPWGFWLQSADHIRLSLLSGAAFTAALVCFFASLKRGDASVVLPFIGGVAPLVTLFISHGLSSEQLTGRGYAGIGLLVLGSLVIASSAGSRWRGAWIWYAILSAALFSVSFTLAKSVYLGEAFVPTLIWTRIGSFIGAAVLLLHGPTRRSVFTTSKSLNPQAGLLFMAGQALAASAGVLQNFAISLGSVTVVNALQGTQFAFLIILTMVLSRYYPSVLKEANPPDVMAKKILAVILIGAGLFASV